MLPDATRYFINGQWVSPIEDRTAYIINPATEQPIAEVALAGQGDVDKAVAAARSAFNDFSKTSVSDRLGWLTAINERLIDRNDEIAGVISAQMGAPETLSRQSQASSGSQHFSEMIRVLRRFPFSKIQGNTVIHREAIGVCVLITPWNWPLNQIAAKVAPALAAGCTMVLKPSEQTPLDAVMLAEIFDEVGVPPGVFNLIHGRGSEIGDGLTGHADVDMVSFTGSTRAGIAISRNAAFGIKRVCLELGGKSAGLLLDDADVDSALPEIVAASMTNTGQSCNALTRLIVPEVCHDDIAQRVANAVMELTVGEPKSGASLGPVANESQYLKVNALIQQGLNEGANLLAGGLGRPATCNQGFFVKPTVFANVAIDMAIAREEIFGPVLCIMPAKSDCDAVRIANDSIYGLSAYVWSADKARAANVAARLRTGMVHINGAPLDASAPFGGYKLSGNGREWGQYGLDEFLEYKSVYGGAC